MHHLTLPELAVRHDRSEQDVWEECQRLGIPVIHGRVDKTLFEKALAAAGKGQKVSASGAAA